MNGQPVPKGKPFTKDDERAKNAGKRSGEARNARKTLREELIELLMVEIKDKNSGKTMQTQAALSAALIKKSLSGDTRAFEIIRDTIGEKPVEQIEARQTVIDMSKFTTEEIKAMLDDEV